MTRCKELCTKLWMLALWIGMIAGGYLTAVGLNNWIMDLLGVIGK